jgi:DNA-binding LytR/AlgR family response regulator
MRILILEDEAPARQRLEQAVRRAEPGAEIVAALPSVTQAAAWLAAHPAPDLVIADLQLADGLSLELFERAPPGCPVIFCTAYDEYLVEAMRHDGIDYLLKPIDDAAVAAALAKYRRLEAHFTGRAAELARALRAGPTRRRLLARRRDGFVALKLDDVAYFVVQDKLVEVVTRSGARLDVDRTLGELEAELDPDELFRANRQYLIRASAVVGFRPLVKGKLIVELDPPPGEDVVVSQENAARFRAWLGG